MESGLGGAYESPTCRLGRSVRLRPVRELVLCPQAKALYLLAKAAHVVAVVTWISGMFAVTHQLSRRAREGKQADAEGLLIIDGSWTVTAMAIVWTLGFWMATHARWWIHPWFITKFVLVFGLSGLHGALAGSLRRLSERPVLPSPWWHRHASTGLLGLLAAVVFLVIVKPSW